MDEIEIIGEIGVAALAGIALLSAVIYVQYWIFQARAFITKAAFNYIKNYKIQKVVLDLVSVNNRMVTKVINGVEYFKVTYLAITPTGEKRVIPLPEPDTTVVTLLREELVKYGYMTHRELLGAKIVDKNGKHLKEKILLSKGQIDALTA